MYFYSSTLSQQTKLYIYIKNTTDGLMHPGLYAQMF